jgi:predicted transcriptional regulator
MRFSQTDLKILEQLAQGTTDIKTIATHLQKSDKQIYASSQKLKTKNILDLLNGNLEPKKIPHVTILLHLLKKHPNLTNIISGSGLTILSHLITPKKVTDIVQETGISKTMVYDKIQQCLSISMVKLKAENTYMINPDIWPDLQEFLTALNIYDETTDPRVPANSTIYYKNNKEILFSNNSTLAATQTGFSAYEQYGLKLRLPTIYYYLPKKTISKKDVFIHSLRIAEKENDIRYLTYLSLFYAKYKNELTDVKHILLDNIKQILQGKHIKGYPSLEEIKEKADVYDIRL